MQFIQAQNTILRISSHRRTAFYLKNFLFKEIECLCTALSSSFKNLLAVKVTKKAQSLPHFGTSRLTLSQNTKINHSAGISYAKFCCHQSDLAEIANFLS